MRVSTTSHAFSGIAHMSFGKIPEEICAVLKPPGGYVQTAKPERFVLEVGQRDLAACSKAHRISPALPFFSPKARRISNTSFSE